MLCMGGGRDSMVLIHTEPFDHHLSYTCCVWGGRDSMVVGFPTTCAI